MNIYDESLELHRKLGGKISFVPKIKVSDQSILSLVYTPGVSAVSKTIHKDKNKAYEYTMKNSTVAIVTDGSAVLGLGNIGPYAALPVMEGKAMLFKELGNVDAVPICLDTQDTEKIIETVKLLAPGFGGINLEDISAPRCFEIEKRLSRELDIPVFHDDQQGTAIVVLAGLMNAARVVDKNFASLKVVISGSGAAGFAISRLLTEESLKDIGFAPLKNIVVCDSKGIVHRNRDDLNNYKRQMLQWTNIENTQGSLADAMRGADVFIGVSKGGIVNKNMVRSMAKNPIIFALANPQPEITPREARDAGAAVTATGRSDYANQINNSLVFPGFFRGLLQNRVRNITNRMKVFAAKAISDAVEPEAERIIPDALDKKMAKAVEKSVGNAL